MSVRDLDFFYAAEIDRGCSAVTVRRTHAMLSAAFAQGRRWGICATIPTALASVPRKPYTPPLAPSVTQVRHLIAVAGGINGDLADAIALLAATGMRRGELCGLRWEDWNASQRSLRIAVSVWQDGAARGVKAPKSGRGRTILLDECSNAILVARRDAGLASPMPLMPDTLTAGFAKVARAAGVSGFHLHCLRHFAATTLIGAGLDVRSVADRLGHADPAMTLRVYAAALPERRSAAADIMGSALGVAS
ncbi:MAG: tyrosine-type recombinase/integrase [Bryobacteraceae bacterium]